ncbi:hypothetical protein IIB34_03420 [PVC group bacterium]|nr:hypothetical protein [PVC group bacterium]
MKIYRTMIGLFLLTFLTVSLPNFAEAGLRNMRKRTYRQSSKIDARRSDHMDADGVVDYNDNKKRRKKRKSKKSEEIVLPPPQGPKKVIMVGKIENKAGGGAQIAIGDPLEEMMTEALIKSNRFIIAERPEMLAGLQEQDFAQSGRTSAVGGAQIGKITNAQIMVTGAITEFDASSGGGQQAFSYGGFGIGFNQAQAHVAVTIRLVDLTTMQVIDSQRVEGKAKAGGATFSYQDSGGWGGSLGGFRKTPIGKASQDAINKALAYIIQRMDSIPWQGAIAVIDQYGIVINNGGENGIKIGDHFVVFQPGPDIIDPSTGVSLGSRKKRVGLLEIISVDAKFSTAKALEGNDFNVGYIIEYMPPPPPPVPQPEPVS